MQRNFNCFAALAALCLCVGCAQSPPVADMELAEPAAAGGSLDERVLYHVTAGELAVQSGEQFEAAEHFLQASRISSDPEIAARAWVLASFAQSSDMAIEASDRWIALDGENPQALLAAATTALEQEDWPTATERLSAFLASEEGNWAAVAAALAGTTVAGRRTVLYPLLDTHRFPATEAELAPLGDIAINIGDYDLALRAADDLVGLAPNNAAYYNWRGRIQSARDERALALEDFRRAAELEPENTGYALSYAGMLHDAGRIDEAMALLQDQDREPMVLFTSALYALELGDRASAKAAFAALTELEPAADVAAERAYLAGQLAEELDDTEGALTWYGRVDGGPRLADAQLRSAILLARNERWPQAQTKLRHLQNGQEDIAAAAFRVEATLLGERGEAEKALATFGRGLALLPDNRELLFGRALYAESVDEVDVALRDLRRLVELDPDNPDALNALGYTLADRTDEFDEAYRLIEKALAARPDEPAIIDSMGWVLYRLGRLDEARGYLERAYSLQQDPEIAAHLGEVLWQLDRRDEARRIWSEALGANPDADIVKETRARLEAR